MTIRAGPRAAWGAAALAYVLIGVEVALAITNRAAFRDPQLLGAFAQRLVPALAIALVGALIASRLPRNPIGWLLLTAATVASVEGILIQYQIHTLVVAPGSLPGGQWAVWGGSLAGGVTFPAIVVFLMVLFPDGQPPSRGWWWRVLLWSAVAVTLVSTLFTVLDPTPIQSPGLPTVPNPTGQRSFKGLQESVLGWVDFVGVNAVVLAAVASLVVRLRKAHGEKRAQVRWVVYAMGVSVMANVLLTLSTLFIPPSPGGRVIGNVVSDLVIILGFGVALPAAMAVAILKYRLYDIDFVISRTLVYGALAAFITAVYVGIVVGIGNLIGSGGQPNLALSILATAVVAVAFQPVKSRVQALANRLVFGNRATPYEVLTAFSHRVAGAYANEEVLPRLSRVLVEGTGAVAASVWLNTDGAASVAATWPENARPVAAAEADRVAIVRHQGETLGELTLKKRQGEPFTPVEEKLLADLAAQAGQVLRNVRLTAELQARLREISAQAVELRASRQRIVGAQDAERRRLERNIHDGAQQHLVALAVKLRLAATLAKRDPEKARRIVRELEGQTADALRTLRDLAQGIYPPALREHGLVEALRAHVEVRATGLSRYDAEVEAAVYFCCLEAIQNASKYAKATRIAVNLKQEAGELRFSVVDDGVGFDLATAAGGSGIQNMQDRLASVGGHLSMASRPGEGTRVEGRLPVAPVPVGAGATS